MFQLFNRKRGPGLELQFLVLLLANIYPNAEDRATRKSNRCFLAARYLLPPAAPDASFSITRFKLKLPASWLGGNSLKVARNSPTMCCAGTQMYAWSNHQS